MAFYVELFSGIGYRIQPTLFLFSSCRRKADPPHADQAALLPAGLFPLTLSSALSTRLTRQEVLAADGDDHADPNCADADGEPTQLADPQVKRQPLGEK